MPPVAQRQWRSLQELEDDPAFLARVAQEFPTLREALAAPRGRRQALRLMAAALALGGLGGCDAGEPGGVLIPAVQIPPGLVPGVPDHYATAHLNNGYALGTVVTHQMGRPIKVEGNPNHPSSLGATDAFAQAELLNFYDPDRAMAILAAGVPSDRQALLTAVAAARAAIAADKGGGFRLLTGTVTSPTLARQIDRLLAAYPDAQWHQWEPVNRDAVLQGAQLAYGRPVDVIPRLDKADVVLAIDSDLFDAAPGWVRYARDFASRRNPTRAQAMSRVYAVESTPSLLGSVADHRVVAGPQELHRAVLALAAGVLGGAAPADVPPWVAPVLADVKAARGRALILIGPDQPPALHALVHAMNEALGARGATLEVIDPVAHGATPQGASLAALVHDMQAGKVATLLILDSNPAFTAPGPLGFAQAMQRVKTSFVLAPAMDETAQLAGWAVPMAHPWESWGDARGHEGTATILQPQALPLYGGMAPVELLGLFIEPFPADARGMVQETWRGSFGGNFEAAWHDALAGGVVAKTASGAAGVTLRGDIARTPPPPPAGLSIRFRPDPSLWDGRHANNGWLQELPRPLTKLTWDNPLLIPPAVAVRLKLRNGDKVRLAIGSRQVTVPVWMQAGQAPDVLVVWLGNGRRVVGEVGSGAGFDYYGLTGAAGPVSIEKARGTERLATTEHHDLLFQPTDGIVRHATLAEFRRDPHFAAEPEKPELYIRKPTGPAAWAMSVDLNSCIGCNACVIACQAENNIAVVGKEQVEMEREMQWLRIDRYYEGTPDQPETYFQPMLCMHCEKAPCELVCPVGATVHDAEGLNVMVYNRCIGTRFCSNNCPYKVRRFNFYGYGDEQRRPPESWNPNVTVRARGVMEKCTYCLQRIAAARIDADRESKPVPTDSFTTACAQACPTRAFTFGNLADDKSAVSQRKKSPLDYQLLEDQHTHPRTTYEALVRNPNPAIPPKEGASG